MKRARNINIGAILARTTPRDFLAATGPFLLAFVFAFVLYGIQVPIDFLVMYGFGLLYWPFYELLGLILSHLLSLVFRSRPVAQWQAFRHGFLPLMLGVVSVGLFYFGQWFWLVIFAHCLGLVLGDPEEFSQEQGSLPALVTIGLLLVVLALIIFGLPVSLSALYQFPNVRGPLAYLPGMLIIGIGYYFCLAAFTVLQRAISRGM